MSRAGAAGASRIERSRVDREGVMKRMAFCSLVSGAIMALAAAAPARAGSPTGLNVPINQRQLLRYSSIAATIFILTYFFAQIGGLFYFGAGIAGSRI